MRPPIDYSRWTSPRSGGFAADCPRLARRLKGNINQCVGPHQAYVDKRHGVITIQWALPHLLPAQFPVQRGSREVTRSFPQFTIVQWVLDSHFLPKSNFRHRNKRRQGLLAARYKRQPPSRPLLWPPCPSWVRRATKTGPSRTNERTAFFSSLNAWTMPPERRAPGSSTGPTTWCGDTMLKTAVPSLDQAIRMAGEVEPEDQLFRDLGGRVRGLLASHRVLVAPIVCSRGREKDRFFRSCCGPSWPRWCL